MLNTKQATTASNMFFFFYFFVIYGATSFQLLSLLAQQLVADPPQTPLQFQHHWFSEDVGSEAVPREQRSEFGFTSQSLSTALPHFPEREAMVPLQVIPQELV